MTALSDDDGEASSGYKRIVIFDAYALIFRAYFAMQRANLRTLRRRTDRRGPRLHLHAVAHLPHARTDPCRLRL